MQVHSIKIAIYIQYIYIYYKYKIYNIIYNAGAQHQNSSVTGTQGAIFGVRSHGGGGARGSRRGGAHRQRSFLVCQ